MIKTSIPTLEEIEVSKKEFVTVLNRFGREIEVSKYQYYKMVKSWECKSIEKEDNIEEIKTELLSVKKELEKELEEKKILVDRIWELEKELEEKPEIKSEIKKDVKKRK